MDTQDSFFPGITSLGDILEAAGYNQGLLIGSEATFGGRELYFTTHGNYHMWDYNYYSSKRWGFSDSYDLSVNSSILGIEGTVNLLKQFILDFENREK